MFETPIHCSKTLILADIWKEVPQQEPLCVSAYAKPNTINPHSADDIKPCPRCGAYIIKMNDGSCNHMTCAVCGCEFCWLCMKEISDLHYLRYGLISEQRSVAADTLLCCP